MNEYYSTKKEESGGFLSQCSYSRYFLGEQKGGHTYIALFQSWMVNITITNSSCFWAFISSNLNKPKWKF